MVNLADSTPLGVAQTMARAGLQVLPARFKEKAAAVDWKKYQTERATNMHSTWFGGSNPRNYWVMTGRMSRVIVLDCDNQAADDWVRAQLGSDVVDTAARVKTSKGHHYWFRLPADWPEDKPLRGWAIHGAGGIELDVRADGGGVIAPPSIHSSGHHYVWERPLAEAAEAPAALLDGTMKNSAPGAATEENGKAKKGTGGQVRSMLSSLLNNGPGENEAGRNEWLAKVAGHYARTYHGQEDLYRAHVEAANNSLAVPLEDPERDKTLESIWRGEHERNPERALNAQCGWLQSGGTRLFTQVAQKAGDTVTFDLAEWANFDMTAKGVMLAEDGGRTYWVRMTNRRPGDNHDNQLDLILDAKILGDDKRFRTWLAAYAFTILPPANMAPKEGSPGQRIQRYLESQQPPQVKVTKTLGWDDAILNGEGGFVTHTGVITPDGLLTAEESGVRPDPHLLVGGQAPHQYGFEGDAENARAVLREVMSFHDPEVVAVFGAWWAACLVKPQLERRTALFPFMAVEAPSESGKTNGFFDMLTQLNGNTRGETAPTKAALRDMAAAHRNGIVWVDDLDDPAYLMELLRAATSGGTLTKMGEDRESVVNTQIVSPIVISGEALGLGSQKALLDRAIVVKVQSPTGRMSEHGNYPQWDDIIALRGRYPAGLSAVAGWLVQDALGVTTETLQALTAGKKGGTGRSGDKDAVLHAGACLLDYLTRDTEEGTGDAWDGSGQYGRAVRSWTSQMREDAPDSRENSLTLEILPWALRTFKYPDRPYAAEHDRDLDRPVFVRNWVGSSKDGKEEGLFGKGGPEPEVYFSVALLAQAWDRDRHGRVSARTQAEAALRDQAHALDLKSTQHKVVGGGGRRAYYFQVGGEVARAILGRAEGQP